MQIPENLNFEHHLWQKGIQYIAGVDEAGRGPLAGPVVAAAVIFKPYFIIEGVQDSKKLSPQKREQLLESIQAHALAIGVGIVDSKTIDRINIRQASFKAMRMAIGRLKIQPEYLLIDGEALPEKFYPQMGIKNGDNRSFTIAAASIVAKVTRDRLMVDLHQKYPQYGFDRHKGYGTKLHREMILQYGPCPVHRRTFLKKIVGNLTQSDNKGS